MKSVELLVEKKYHDHHKALVMKLLHPHRHQVSGLCMSGTQYMQRISWKGYLDPLQAECRAVSDVKSTSILSIPTKPGPGHGSAMQSISPAMSTEYWGHQDQNKDGSAASLLMALVIQILCTSWRGSQTPP